MLKISGRFVSPFEANGTLLQHPCVLEVAVIGVPNPNRLMKCKAYVVLRAGNLA